MRLLLWLVGPLLTSSVAVSACSRSAKGTDTTAAAVVARMYQDYSWETDDSIPAGRHPLFSAPAETLREYLDSALTRAVLADRACQIRTHEECNLDFDPLWDSQDPTGASVQVLPAHDSTRVDARIGYRASTELHVVRYRMRRVGTGWRIADMSGEGWPSLLKTLTQR
jgi:hypothetical protein